MAILVEHAHRHDPRPRGNTRAAPLARFDIARSDEGWKIVFRMNDPFRLSSRHNKRTAQVPFAQPSFTVVRIG